MKLLLIISALALILILCGCESKPKRNAIDNNNRITNIAIDTINIHGQKHEILFYKERKILWNQSYAGIMHSPECWCLKKGE